jgi:hypothetical protein
MLSAPAATASPSNSATNESPPALLALTSDNSSMKSVSSGNSVLHPRAAVRAQSWCSPSETARTRSRSSLVAAVPSPRRMGLNITLVNSIGW